MSDKLEALKAAALAATPGPWIKTEDDWRDSEDALITCDSRKGMTAIAKIDGGGEESGYSEPFKSEQQANSAFIAAASPDVVISLLAALEEKDQRIKELEGDVRFERLRLNETEIAALIKRADSAEQREEHLKADAAVMGRRIEALHQQAVKDGNRIAELERANAAQDAHINQQQDRIDTVEKKNGELGKYTGQLEQRLQQPIRQQHAEWSNATFGNVGPIGPLRHLSKEALEAAAKPDDLLEWADIQFLFWDALRRAGITDQQLVEAMETKLPILKARKWPEPKDGEPRFHIKVKGE